MKDTHEGLRLVSGYNKAWDMNLSDRCLEQYIKELKCQFTLLR